MFCFFWTSSLVSNSAFSWITESVFIWEEKFKTSSVNKLLFVRLHGFKVTASSSPVCSRSDMASGQPTVCYWRTRQQTCDWLGSEMEGGVAVEWRFVMCLCIWQITQKNKKKISNWEKLVDRKYFKTSEGLKLKDVGQIWRNVENSKSLWGK